MVVLRTAFSGRLGSLRVVVFGPHHANPVVDEGVVRFGRLHAHHVARSGSRKPAPNTSAQLIACTRISEVQYSPGDALYMASPATDRVRSGLSNLMPAITAPTGTNSSPTRLGPTTSAATRRRAVRAVLSHSRPRAEAHSPAARARNSISGNTNPFRIT